MRVQISTRRTARAAPRSSLPSGFISLTCCGYCCHVNLANKAGETVLSQAIARSQFNNAKLLRAAGAKFASPNDALIAAASSGDISELTHLLDDEKADPNFHQRSGQPVLCVAAQKGNTAAVRVLLAHGADPNLRDSNQQPPLYWALTSRHVSTAQVLIDAHADLRAETPGHRTLLVTAAYCIDDTALAQFLLDAGVGVNQPDIGGETALMNAASAGVSPMVELLLRAGADPTLRDHQGRSAADRASQRNNSKLAKTLAQAEAAWNARGH
jgi:ankyrin repeat protein